MKQYNVRAKIQFGQDALLSLRQVKGTKALIVSDQTMDTLGYVKIVQDYLTDAGIESEVFEGVRPDPDVEDIVKGVLAFDQCCPDVLVALGGGSVIDSAKGILYLRHNLSKENKKNFQKPLFVAIPSTSGTGSEVTNFLVMTVNQVKTPIVSDLIAPDIAILDSVCIKNVPRQVIADTGIDVLVHALEAYVSTEATDFTDALAEKSAQLVFRYLKTLYDDVDDDEARNHIQNASCMAGMAFTNANLGITHSLAHAFGGVFHVSHGRSNAYFIEQVIEYNANIRGDANGRAARKYAKLAALLDISARTPREGTINLIAEIRKLKKGLNIPGTIQKAGNIKEEEYHSLTGRMAELALSDQCTQTTPRQPEKGDLEKILSKAYMP